MAYLNYDSLIGMGFGHIGRDVKISDKAVFYEPEKIYIGDRSRIDDFCVVSGNVCIGMNVHFAVFCNVAGGEEGVSFGDFSGLAYNCQVFSQSDDYTGRSMTNPTVPNEYKLETKSPVKVGRHSIVGAGSIVLPGVTLGEGTAVGALSLVTKDTEEWSVYFGAPAKRLKARKRMPLEMELAYLAGEC